MVSKKKAEMIRIRWVQSAIACPEKHKKVIRGLGFRKLQQTVERPDTPAIRGMIAKVPHLVTIVS
jgi:large subunit ribosomal protein L30